jgi:[acyl-carrier-protein] S-malonyltransferase
MVMRKIAFIFPGQGSQNIGMGRSLYDHFAIAREVFDTAEDILKWDIKGLCFDNKGDKINLTEYTQPAILVTSISAWKILSAEGIKPGVVAGHSLGEYSAIVAAEGGSFIEMLPVVQTRGKLMQNAVPTGKGMMAALLGVSKETIAEICEAASVHGIVVPANYNAPDQIVIAGGSDAVNKAMDIAKEKGVRRIVPLNVSVPSHSPLMKTASEKLSKVLDAVKFSNLKTPLMTNVDARIIHSSSEIKDALVRQLPPAD